MGREGAVGGGPTVPYRPLPPLTAASLSPASRSCSSVLQKAKRTRVRPSSGRLKKLEPGTGATPASHVVFEGERIYQVTIDRDGNETRVELPLPPKPETK